MGKMKELYIAMIEAEWEGTPNEFLTWWMHNESKKIDKKNENNKIKLKKIDVKTK
tara:strand:- start:516 stop:680 length:165 start_codon:yes stop_codon:yes gene_type:complete